MPALTRLHDRLHTRRRLRQPSGLRFAMADRIDQLNPAAWDALAEGRSWFFSRDYLRMLEQTPPSCIEPRYGLISDDDGPVAAVVMQWVELKAERLRPHAHAAPAAAKPRLKKLLDRAATGGGSALINRISERVLVCGNLLSYGEHAVAAARDIAPQALWPAVAELLYRVRRADKLAGQAGFVLIKDVLEAQADSIAVLRGLSYRGVETGPNMVLQLDPAWRSHADYLASLASKYRSATRKQILEPLQRAGLELRAFVPDAALAERMHVLYLQVHENAGFRPFTLHPDYFRAFSDAAGARLRCTGLFDVRQQLLGFIVTLGDGAQALAYHIGFDRAAAERLPLYLGLLHASVGDGIALGARELSLGRTALEPKARLGALPQPMTVWMRHRQPLLNQLTLRLLGLVTHEEAPERKPFKAEKPAAG